MTQIGAYVWLNGDLRLTDAAHISPTGRGVPPG